MPLSKLKNANHLRKLGTFVYQAFKQRSEVLYINIMPYNVQSISVLHFVSARPIEDRIY